MNVHRQAMTDGLTGLPNRLAIEDQLDRLRRDNTPSAVAFVDVDHFKLINDTYGHATGDLVLQVFTRRLLDALPAEATLARMGGDEFAIVLPNTSVEEAATVIGAACCTLAAPIELEVDGAVLTDGSASVGVVATQGSSNNTIWREADAALYVGKARGRGQVVVGGPDLEDFVSQRRGLAEQVASLESALQRLERENRTDPLTAMPNRRAFDAKLAELDQATLRSGSVCSVLFLDIDRFHFFNHQHGDLEGDRLLGRIGKIINSVCRAEDDAFRKGGEEFVVTLPGLDLHAASRVAERARRTVEEAGIVHGGLEKVPIVTVTIGVAERTNDEKLADTVERAASAAYDAKKQDRRNTVTVGRQTTSPESERR